MGTYMQKFICGNNGWKHPKFSEKETYRSRKFSEYQVGYSPRKPHRYIIIKLQITKWGRKSLEGSQRKEMHYMGKMIKMTADLSSEAKDRKIVEDKNCQSRILNSEQSILQNWRQNGHFQKNKTWDNPIPTGLYNKNAKRNSSGGLTHGTSNGNGLSFTV